MGRGSSSGARLGADRRSGRPLRLLQCSERGRTAAIDTLPRERADDPTICQGTGPTGSAGDSRHPRNLKEQARSALTSCQRRRLETGPTQSLDGARPSRTGVVPTVEGGSAYSSRLMFSAGPSNAFMRCRCRRSRVRRQRRRRRARCALSRAETVTPTGDCDRELHHPTGGDRQQHRGRALDVGGGTPDLPSLRAHDRCRDHCKAGPWANRTRPHWTAGLGRCAHLGERAPNAPSLQSVSRRRRWNGARLLAAAVPARVWTFDGLRQRTL